MILALFLEHLSNMMAFCILNDGFCVKNDGLCIQMMAFCIEMMDYASDRLLVLTGQRQPGDVHRRRLQAVCTHSIHCV